MPPASTKWRANKLALVPLRVSDGERIPDVHCVSKGTMCTLDTIASLKRR